MNTTDHTRRPPPGMAFENGQLVPIQPAEVDTEPDELAQLLDAAGELRAVPLDHILAPPCTPQAIVSRLVAYAALQGHPWAKGRKLEELGADIGVTRSALSQSAKRLSRELGIVAEWQRKKRVMPPSNHPQTDHSNTEAVKETA